MFSSFSAGHTWDICQRGHSQGNCIFQDISRAELLFPRQSIQDLKVINEDTYEKSISYLINIWSTIDIFMVQPPTHPF